MSPKWKAPDYPPPQRRVMQIQHQQIQQTQLQQTLPPPPPLYEQLNPIATLATLRRLTPNTELPQLSVPPEADIALAVTDSFNAPSEKYSLYYEVGTRMYAWRPHSHVNTITGENNGLLVRVEHDANAVRDKPVRPRSRDGCLTCRQRKKRCCERKPVCQECARLGIKCRWPYPGSERKNRRGSANVFSNSGGSGGSGGVNGNGSGENSELPVLGPDEMYHEEYGVIKVLRGVVEYSIDG